MVMAQYAGFGFPTEEDICNRYEGQHALTSSAAQYWIKGEHNFKVRTPIFSMLLMHAPLHRHRQKDGARSLVATGNRKKSL